MRFRRLLGFVLVGSLCMSDMAWAGTGTLRPEEPAVLEEQDEEPVIRKLGEPLTWEDFYREFGGSETDTAEQEQTAEEEALLSEEDTEEARFGGAQSVETADGPETMETSVEEPAETESKPEAGGLLGWFKRILTRKTVTPEVSFSLKVQDSDTACQYKPLKVTVSKLSTATGSEIETEPEGFEAELLLKKGSGIVGSFPVEWKETQEITIGGQYFASAGSYTLVVQDAAKKEEISDPCSVEVKELQNFVITLKKQIFTKVYKETDPWDKSDYVIPEDAYTATVDGTELAPFPLKTGRISLEQKSDSDAGKYEITGFTTSKYGKITVVKNEYSYLVIEKAKKEIKVNTVTLPPDGVEKNLDLSAWISFGQNEKPESIKLGALPSSAAGYFSVMPGLSGTKLHFAVKKNSTTNVTLSLPVELVHKNYTYVMSGGEPVSLTLQIQPRRTTASRTAAEIRSYFKSHPFDLVKADRWNVTPDAKAGEAGELTADSLQNGLNALNFIRYVAGMSEVAIDAGQQELAQAGAALLDVLGELTHEPEHPKGVPDEFYNLAYKGTSSSNIAWASGNRFNLARYVIDSWMEDSDESNVDRLGHRRWCLNPDMGKTGLGHSGGYAAMYSFDRSNRGESYDYIPWPAAVTPVEYFKGAWNVTISKSTYTVDLNALTVTMKSKATGKTYVLDKNCTDKSGKYLNYNSDNYGYDAVIVFEPNADFKAGDTVTVTVSGLKDRYNNEETLEYTVNFIPMDVTPLKGIQLNKSSATLKPGATLQLSTSLNPSNATVEDMSKAVWSSSDENVASVDSNGLVTAKTTGTADITANMVIDGKAYEAVCKVTVKKTSSGGSSGGGGSRKPASSSSSKKTNANANANNSNKNENAAKPADVSVPEYVVTGNWVEEGANWKFFDSNGNAYVSRWAAVYNPYADPARGQSNFDWFWFGASDEMVTGWHLDADGNYYYLNPASDGTKGRMITGWHLDADGNYYYLNPKSDGTRGKMMTGWVWIAGADGVEKCYYFNEKSDGTKGKMMSNTVIDGYTLNANGEWVVDGVVQTK